MARKIVHVVLSLNVGGLERVVLALLARLDRARYDPVVCALDEPGVLAPELDRIGVSLRVVPRRPGIDPGLPMRLARLLRHEGAELVHTHNASPHLYGALGARLARIRVVHTKHGRNEPGSARKVLVNRFASSMTCRVVAVSEDSAAIAVEVELVPARKVVTIVNGVDTAAFCPGADPRAARARLGIPQGGFHVGCVARLSAVKDHLTLLEAFARLRAARPDAYLTLVGDGAERRALEEGSARLGLDGAVTFVGERGDVASLLHAFDVFALSSLSEGISMTLLEAASTGLPVVATDVGGNAEIVIQGASGLLVPPRDPGRFAAALAEVARRADRIAMGARGRDQVTQRFSVDQMARAYHDLYGEILGLR